MTKSQRAFLLNRLNELERASYPEIDKADERNYTHVATEIRRVFGKDLRKRYKVYRALCQRITKSYGVEVSVERDDAIRIYPASRANSKRRLKLREVVKKYRDALVLGPVDQKASALAFSAEMEAAIKKVI